MRRQKSSLYKGVYARLTVLFTSWRWRICVALAILAIVPAILLFINRTTVQALPCPCNVLGSPSGQGAFFQSGGIELGFKFKADVSGYITGVRFYKQGSMGGTHTGRLWTTGGSSLATATFSSETGSGWQEVVFGTPVSVTAGTTYVASVTMADGNYIATANYFTSDIVNFPLRAPSAGSSGGNGVFNTTAGSFPAATFNSTNYWIDVAYRANLGSSAPVVSSTDPTSDATDVNPGKTIRAVFDDAMDQNSISASTFTMKDSDDNAVTGTVSYNNANKTASFVSSAAFTEGETYTATIAGGSGTVAKNMEGIALAADYSWSFTILADDPCPCSLKDRANPAGATTVDDTGGYELGIKIKPSTNGYITAIRFYKPIISTETTHTGHIWSSTGTNLATVTFADESDYGWQEARLSTPLQVSEGQLYIVSYGTTTAVFMRTLNALTSNLTSGPLVAYADNSSENAASLSGNRNGVFTTTAGNYPDAGGPSYYWVDPVFSTHADPPNPPAVQTTQPADDSYGASRTAPIAAAFDHAINGATVTNSSVRLFDSANNQVSGTASYNSASHTVLFTPTNPLSYGGAYTATLSASIADTTGTALGSDYSWNFTVGSQLSSNPNQGSGGPILVITSSTNKYSAYYAEILRTEGLNYFDVKDIGTVSSTTLDSYDAVVLSEMSLTQPQADMFTAWVTGGGNLVAMRPDKKLAGTLGLSDAGTTRSNQYFLVNTAAVPGTGIVGETIQFKGTADNYSLGSATAIATLYSDASTSTANPAVTARSVGSEGGTAVAFTYDLAKSVIALHQGNQAWAAQDRDGNGVIRSNDLFFGAKAGDVQADWVDLNKVHIPQADEQQRLLANVLTEAAKDRKPLPRFWYLPNDYRAAMVMAGDDHGLSDVVGTERVFNNWLNESPTNCSLADWQCVRGSGYLYSAAALTSARASQYHGLGFEVGDHPPNAGGCANYTSYAQLGATQAAALATFRAKYTNLPNQRSTRFHCYSWADWDSQPRTDLDNGIRYDLNFVSYPSSWLGSRAALTNGSGMNMRFTEADGDILDVYQGVTDFENSVTSSSTISEVLTNATGARGYYGIFGTHYDMGDNYHATLFDAAQAADVPIISADQALTWLDGRNSSTFSDLSGSDGRFTFAITAAVGATGLRAMMPIQDAGGTLSGITLSGNAVSYQTQTVKGVQYAVFDGVPGNYTVTYSDYAPTSPDSSGDSSTSSSSGSAAQKKATPTSNNGIFDGNQEGLEDAIQGTTPDKDEASSEPTDTEKEHSIETDSQTGSSWVMWLIGMIFVAVVTSLIVLGLRRRQHDSAT